MTITPESANPYYERYGSELFTDKEIDRLAGSMERWLNSISPRYLEDIDGSTVVDVGAGSGTRLKEYVEEEGGIYEAVDINPRLLEVRGDQSHCHCAPASELPMDDRSVDRVHARALNAWLPKDERKKAVEEMLRITKDDGEIVIINFDWNSSKGGSRTRTAKYSMMALLAASGFSPDYGANQHKEIESVLINQRRAFEIKTDKITDNADKILRRSVIEEAYGSLIEVLNDKIDEADDAKDRKRLEDIKLRIIFFINQAREESIAGKFPSLPDIYVTRIKLGSGMTDSPTIPKVISEETETVTINNHQDTDHAPGYHTGHEQRPISGNDITIEIITEEGAPDTAREAQKLQARCYLKDKIVREEAIKADGTLGPDHDKARGKNVDYYVANSKASEEVVAGIRVVHGRLEDLPSFARCRSGIKAEDLSRIEKLAKSDSDGQDVIVELAALSKEYDPPLDSTVVMCLLRRALHDCIRAKKICFMGLVPDAFKLFQANYGEDIVKSVGNSVKLEVDGVTSGIELTPVMIYPNLILENMLASATAALNSGNVALYYIKLSIMSFFTEGLESEYIPQEVQDLLA